MKRLGKWWCGLRCTCRGCGEMFRLDDRDMPRRGKWYRAEVACPACGKPVAVMVPRDATVPLTAEEV